MVPLVSSEAAMWQESLDRVVPAIVVIRVCSVGAFDGESASYGKATGFVVDKARGIILTNRHVVTPGPTMADAVFMNKEEVDLIPIYYDPVHDFGFYRFDPKAVRFMEVTEVELNPDGAKVGVEIRVVGNDSGEKLSILPGILARLDRAAPEYERGYRDFNTFYLAAASSTSGGSSGSPVLTVDGKAVALNCGARVETAAAFYLPLPKVVRALELIQRGEKVTRGTLQTVLKHTAFDEARRLGLRTDTETLLRKEFPDETGVLAVEEVVPEGPADGALEPGDVLIRMGGKMMTTFLPWETALDDGVGEEVELQVQRGGNEVIVRVRVGDLQAITPSEFLEVSSSVLHPLSYQQARNYNLPVKGVYLAEAGYMLERAWVASQSLITSIGSDPTPDLDACEAALCKHPDGARVSVRYKALGDRHRTKTAVITIDRKWFTMQRVRRNDEDGLWHATPSPLPPSAPPPFLAPSPKSNGSIEAAADAKAKAKAENEVGGGVASSLVMVIFDIPHLVDGVSGSYCVGVGVVVDKELGLVVVDKTTVQVALGDVMLTFNGSEEVAAHPIFSHPTQNFSVVQFDPSLVKGSFTAAVLSSRETEHEDDCDDDTADIAGVVENGGGFVGGTAAGTATASTSTMEAATVNVVTSSSAKDAREGARAPAVDAAIPSSPSLAPPSPQSTPLLANGDADRQNQSATNASRACFPGKNSFREAAVGTANNAECGFPPPLRPGDMAEFYGLTAANAPVRQRASVVKLERLSLTTSAHPQFTAHSVEVLQFDQVASCLGGVFVAAPRSGTGLSSSSPSPSVPFDASADNGKCHSPGASSVPVISAFWHCFAFSTTEGRKHTMRGLPAPVVGRAVERIRRDLLKKKQEQRQQRDQDQQGQGEPPRSSRGVNGHPPTTARDGGGSGVDAGEAQGSHTLGEARAVEVAPASVDEVPSTAASTAVEVENAVETPETVPSRGGKNLDGMPPPTRAAATGTKAAEERPASTARKSSPRKHPGALAAEGREGSNLLGAAPCLPLQLVTVELSKARAGLGLSDEWSSRIERKCGERRQKQVLEVRRCMAGTPAFSVVETGDIILAVNGKTVTRFREVEVAVEEGEGEPVRLNILRQLKEKEITVKPSHLPTRETDRLFMWAGQMIQAPHLAVLQRGFLPKQGGGVYSSRWCYGSPAHKYRLGCTNWIVEVNGIPTPTLDAFLDVVKQIGDKSPARVKTVGLDSKVEVTTLRTDHHYWPTLELRRSGGRWERTSHKGASFTTSSTSPAANRDADSSRDSGAATSEATSTAECSELLLENPAGNGVNTKIQTNTIALTAAEPSVEAEQDSRS